MRILILMLALCLALCTAEAKLPMVGDYVRVSYNLGAGPSVSYEGNITDISDGLICLNCSNVIALNGRGEGATPDGIEYPFNVCIGTGQVSMLIWLVPDEVIYVKQGA
jgi:hypothetical protein